MITLKIYQVRGTVFDTDGNLIPKDQRTYETCEIGTADVPESKLNGVEESIWDLFNWTCWRCLDGDRDAMYEDGLRNGVERNGIKIHPNSNADGFCNSDIFFQLGDTWKVADHTGWNDASTYDEAVELCKDHIQF